MRLIANNKLEQVFRAAGCRGGRGRGKSKLTAAIHKQQQTTGVRGKRICNMWKMLAERAGQQQKTAFLPVSTRLVACNMSLRGQDKSENGAKLFCATTTKATTTEMLLHKHPYM